MVLGVESEAAAQTLAKDVAPANEEDNQQEHEAAPHQRSSSYRVLATFKSSEEDVTDNTEDDPMAWADLEAFGGTKKTLEKPRPLPPLTPEEVRQQLLELHEIENKMKEAAAEVHPTHGMLETIQWLKQHQQESEHFAAQGDKRKQPLKRSTSFVKSVLGFFRRSDQKQDVEHTENQQEVQECDETLPSLHSPWGQEALGATWAQVGFALLNQGVLEDVRRVKSVIESGELTGASTQAIISLSKWMWHFDEHLQHVVQLKQYLLEERMVLAGVGYKVTTVYDNYKAALGLALEGTHGDRNDLATAILNMFTQLEATLQDEAAVVTPLIEQTLTEAQEYEAVSALFQNLHDDEPCCVIVAKLLGYMKNHMSDSETEQFLALFEGDMRERLAGEWMRHYAAYLELLDEFSVSFEGSRAFFT